MQTRLSRQIFFSKRISRHDCSQSRTFQPQTRVPTKLCGVNRSLSSAHSGSGIVHLAPVGLTEKQARQQGVEIRVAKLPVAAIPRAKTASETRGFIKAVGDVKTDRILGCTILSVEAGEMISTVQMTISPICP